MKFGMLLFGLMTILHQTPDLDQLRWHTRVVLIFSPESGDSQVAEQERLLEKASSGLEDRDMKVFELSGQSEEVKTLRKRFNLYDQGFAVVLIGKDGSGKLHRTKPVTADELFQLVATMPMRKQELKQNR